MSPENAKLVNETIALFILIAFLLILQGRIYIKNKSGFFEKNKRILSIITVLSMTYPLYEILSVLFKWKQ